MLKLKNCCLDELENLFQDKFVYGYGAGRYLDKFCFRNPQVSIERYLYQLVDRKKGQKKLGNTVIEIISMEELRKQIKPADIILLTTSHYYMDIIEEMDSYNELDGVTCYILPFIENNFEKCRIDWELYRCCGKETEQIPRIIHYCWFGGNEIPEKQKKCIESWKQFCPEYEIIKWSEENYDVKKNPYVDAAYQNKKWAFVSDYARIDVVNRYGGIYLDTDVELLKPLDELLHFSGFMGFETWTMVNTGLGFGSVKKHVILEKILDAYNHLQFIKASGELDLTPCPVIQTDVLEKIGLIRNNEVQELKDGFIILPTPFLCGMNFGTRKIEITDCTYTIHHYAGSWLDDDAEGFPKRRRDAGPILLKRMREN